MAQNPVIKIGVIGPESTGKTGLCEALAKYYNSVWAPEYAREYFNTADINNYSLTDLELIAKKQMELWQKLIPIANSLLFCDTDLITLKIWAELEFKKKSDYIEKLLKNNYCDYYLITNTDVPWQKDTQRKNKFDRQLILNLNIAEVKNAKLDYYLISGTDEKRLTLATEAIKQKYNF